MDGLRRGDRIVVVTWLHEADRNTLYVHPRGDTTEEPVGRLAAALFHDRDCSGFCSDPRR